MMYLGDPPELTEHLFTSGRSKCLEMKKNAEETSFAYYECARVNAVIKGSKIVSIIEEIEVINDYKICQFYNWYYLVVFDN